MSFINRKANLFQVVLSAIGVVYFGYILFSTSYNASGYHYLDNVFGQFAFWVFVVFFSYAVLSFLKADRYFRVAPVVLLLLVGLLHLMELMLLLPGTISVLLVSFYQYFRYKRLL